MISLQSLAVAADGAAWRAAGFRVEDPDSAAPADAPAARGEAAGGDRAAPVVRVGSVTLSLAGSTAGKRIVSAALRGIREGSELDGLPVTAAATGSGADAASGADPHATGGMPADAAPPAPHPNGVTCIDHLVAFTPDLERTVAAGQALGLDLRRIRDEPAPAGSPRQAFFRLGELLLEVAQAPPDSPLKPDSSARFYGLAFLVADIDATAASLGPLCSDPRDAIQPGRRIATVRQEANLGLPIAFMTPRPS